MNLRLYSLTLSAFAIGISEFVLVGLLGAIADDLGVSIGSAGLLVTVYALSIAFFSPLLTSWASRQDSRQMLTLVMGIFALGNLIVAAAPTLAGVAIGRALAGAAHGTTFALGAPVAATLVPRERAARAISMVFLGLTVAMVVGVPAGTALGGAIGWRATFVVVAALGLIAATGIWLLVPSSSSRDGGISLKDELRLLGYRPLALTYAVTALGFGATFSVFTFLDPLLKDGAGFSTSAVTWVLVIFGAGTVAGNLLGGRLTDSRGAQWTVRVALVGLAVSLAAVLLTQGSQPAIVVNIGVWGVFAFLISPAVQSHAVALAGEIGVGAEKAASGLNIAAFNVGIAAASFLGGRLLEHGDPSRTPWVGIAFVIVAFIASAGIARGSKASATCRRTSRSAECACRR